MLILNQKRKIIEKDGKVIIKRGDKLSYAKSFQTSTDLSLINKQNNNHKEGN